MLDHPNIVKFLGACCKPPKLCFVMELLEVSLYELLHKSNQYLDYVCLVKMAVRIVWAGVVCATMWWLFAHSSSSAVWFVVLCCRWVLLMLVVQANAAAGMAYLHSLSPPIIHRCVYALGAGAVQVRMQVQVHGDTDFFLPRFCAGAAI